ncbi:MAG: hypothetical protein ACOYYJ_20875 [Chloroflexota bacterium]
MKNKNFPMGWDEARVKQILAHYEAQSEDEAVAEDEKAFESKAHTTIEVPIELMPVIREIIAQYEAVGHA